VKLYRDALLRARANPVAFAASAAGIAALAIVVVTGIGYLVSSVPPYGFYYDLGVDILATSTIAHWLNHLVDLKDALGWAGWGDRSAFAYAPMTNVAVSVAFAKVFAGDAFSAVKAVQVLEVLLAAASAFALYRLLRGPSPWAWLAAAVYALAPEQLLMIRGDLSFGFAAALAPLAMAVPLWLVRRYGMWSLPLCGALAALLSGYFTIEHLFLHGLPAYGFAVALAYDRRRAGAWIVASLSGLAIVFASLAYVVLPTNASLALFSPSATVGAALAGGEFAQYQNGPLALASLVMNEFIVNPRKEFGLGLLQLLTVPIGLSLWVLAIGWAVAAVKRHLLVWGEGAFLVTGLVCTVLSTGAFIPGVGIIWWIVSQLPVLNNIRTPDRFIGIGLVVIVISAVSQLERLDGEGRFRRFAAGSATWLAAAGIAAFFVFRTFLGDTTPVRDKEPFLDEISSVAQARDNRVANLALDRKGSIFDTTLYGAPMPFLDFQNDFAERYEGDGLGGSGMLARGNVATIVATPPWTPDSPLLGQSTLVRANFLSPIAGEATTVAAYGAQPVRGYVRNVRVACLFGGPGLLDNLVALPSFAGTAVEIREKPCAQSIFADAAPLEPLLGGAIAYRWPATVLFPHAGVMRDIDYRLTLGRFLINDAWYRNSVDGDSPVLSPAALSLDAGNQTSSVFEIDREGMYAIALHAVCHGDTQGRIVVDGAERAFACKAHAGFQWVEVPAGRLKPGLHGLKLSVDSVAAAPEALATTWLVAFDGAVVVRKATVVAPAAFNAFLFSASRLNDRSQRFPPDASLVLTNTDGMQPIGASKGDVAQRLLARTPDAVASYRFRGPSGRYRVWAYAYAESGFDASMYVGIYTTRRCCAGVATAAGVKGTAIISRGDLSLVPGDLVHVLVHTSSTDNAAIAQLFGVKIEPLPAIAQPYNDRALMVSDFDFLGPLRHLAPQIPAFGYVAKEGHIEIEPFNGVPVGAPLVLNVQFPNSSAASPTSLRIAADYGNSALRSRLQCGTASVLEQVAVPVSEIVLPPTPSGDCTVTLTSLWSTVYVLDVTVSRSAGSAQLAGTRYLTAGRYRVLRVRRGAGEAGGSVTVDGVPASATIGVARSGFHDVRWNDAPADAYLLGFVPAAWPDSNAVDFKQTASARWDVSIDRKGSVEAAVFPDGYWRLVGDRGALTGRRCDVENTCFTDVPTGRYRLLHVWPSYIKLGFAVTLLAWILAIAALVVAQRRSEKAPAA
jgi:hypothetical protein